MYRLIILFILINTYPSFAQTKKDFVNYDKDSYEMYVDGKWDALIDTGKKALKEDFDFFFLRARLGIAYYEKENYARSIHHLKRALEMNDADPAMLEYLYYAYQFSGRYQEASHLFYKYSNLFQDKDLTIKPSTFDHLYLEGGVKFSDHVTSLGTEVNNISYGQVGLSLNLKGNFIIDQYAGILNNALVDKFVEQNNLYHYYYNLRQFEYYVKGKVLLGKGWLIQPAYHYIRVDAISNDYNDYYFGLSLNKNFNKVRLGLDISKSDIYDTDILQIVPEVSYYPLGNTKLYFVLQNLYQQSEGTHSSNNLQGTVGVKLFKKTWLEGFFSQGKGRFLSFNQGQIIYNNPDYLISRGGILLYQYFNKSTRLVLSYQLENKEQYLSGNPYTYRFIMLGLNIKF